MTHGDWIGLIASYIYAFALLIVIEFIGKKAKWPHWVTRKLVHIGAGMWVWAMLFYFDHWLIGIIPFATFIVLNYIFYRWQIFKTMDDEDSTPGTVYFALSITTLFLLFWRTGGQMDRSDIAVASIMAMTWGDALASLIGKAFGKKKYKTFGHYRTWEGSVTMFLVSYLAIGFTLTLLPGSILSPHSVVYNPSFVWGISLVPALIAAFAEGLSPAGTDNLSVPLLTAFTLWFIL